MGFSVYTLIDFACEAGLYRLHPYKPEANTANKD
nr:hypothetical protein [Mucilaginibacter sp. E4BP6]